MLSNIAKHRLRVWSETVVVNGVVSGDPRYQHSAVAGCVPAARLQDPAPHLPRAAPHRQVSPLHLHHEHRQHPRHRHHHQLELPRSPHTLHAKLDQSGVHQGMSYLAMRESR